MTRAGALNILKTVLTSCLIFCILNLTLIFGMFSVVQQNAVFKAYYQVIKDWFDQAAGPYPPDTMQFNTLGQLVQYPGKHPRAAPVITARTMVAFVFGQSNAANHGGQKYTDNSGRIVNFFDGQYYVASDPLLGASGNGGSVWVLMAQQLIKQGRYDQVVLIPAAIGGTSVSQWRPGGELHPMLLQRLHALKQQGLQVTHFLWHQGEADNPSGSQPGIALKAYASALQSVIATCQQAYPQARFYVAVATQCFRFAPASAELQAIQRQMSRLPGVYAGPDTDQIGLDDRYDDCHFSDSGLRKHADGWVKALTTPP